MTENIYKSPPITEAVIGINFTSPLDDQHIKSLNKKLSKFYPDQQIIANVSFAVSITDNNFQNPNTEMQKEDSYRLSTHDQTQIVVLSKSSFLFSQLAPYQGWENLYERFTRDWAILKKASGFREISRIGVRYVNRIDLPVVNNLVEYEKYLNIYPFLPKSLENVNGYAIQVILPLEKIGCNLNINSGGVPSPLLNHLSFLIDLDISKDQAPPQNDTDIFELLNLIRVEKNRVFEECITQSSRELFNHGQ